MRFLLLKICYCLADFLFFIFFLAGGGLPNLKQIGGGDTPHSAKAGIFGLKKRISALFGPF